MPHTYPRTLTAVVWRKNNEAGFRRQLQMLKGSLNQLCHGDISASYSITTAMKHSDLLYTTVDLDTGNPLNFAMVKLTSASSAYIEIICSIHGGGALMKYIMMDCRARGIKKLTLAALPTVINFYRKFDFKPGKECAEDPEIVKIEEARDIRGKKLATFKDVENDRSFKSYLSFLIRKGLAADPKCRYVDDCNVEGYYMTLCMK